MVASREDFSLEIPSLTGGSFQDFPHLDHLNGNGSSPNPLFGGQNSCLDPLYASHAFGSCLSSFDLHETKPFSNGSVMPYLMDNNFPRIIGNGIPDHSPILNTTPITMVPPSLRGGHLVLPFNFKEIDPLKCRPPDEGSCTTVENGCRPEVGSASVTPAAALPRKTGKGRKKKSNVVKGQWTTEEDRRLIQLVERHGVRKWSQIAQMLNGRIGKQCRERWHNHLRPDIKKDMWSEEEDKILIETHAEIGNKWAEIAKRLPGRTENSIKNHWNATKRRQLSRRKCRSKYPRQSSLLQDYIKSLNIETINAGCRKKSLLTSGNNSMIPETTATALQMSQTQPLQQVSEAYSEDRLVPEYDFSEVPEFNFDANILEESSIDSLLDEVNCAASNALYGSNHEMELPPLDMASMIHCEVKKELDLVEMINQVNL
ncbi:hypothetical protein Ancab_039106 [Ancistrocladus abbreviatus]